MARKRMIDPKIWQSSSFGSLSVRARLLFIFCVSYADDCGRLDGSPEFLGHFCFAYDSLRGVNIEKLLEEIEKEEMIFRYEVNGKKYILLPKWFEYQYIQKPYPSKIPLPLQEDYRNNTIILQYLSHINTLPLHPKTKQNNNNTIQHNNNITVMVKEKGGGVGFNSEEEDQEKIFESEKFSSEDFSFLKNLIDEYDFEYSDPVAKKILSLNLSEEDIRDAFCIASEKKKDLRYALGILERKKKEAKAIEAEEGKRQKHYEAEREKEQAMVQEWQEKSLSPEENIARLQSMISGLGQKMVIPAETDAPVSL